MKKEQGFDSGINDSGNMPPEYELDYRKARPNRFAPGIVDGSLIVVLEPDIAQVFKTPDSVKNILRALIEALPERPET
jgi:hypothetical protein